jgi:hypothetical protein
MPNFIQIQRDDPDVGYLGVKNDTLVVAAETAIEDAIPVYWRTDSGAATPDGIYAVRGNDTNDGLAETLVGISGPNKDQSLAFGDVGLVQVWGYRSDVEKNTGDNWTTAGWIVYTIDNAVECDAIINTNAAVATARGVVVGQLLTVAGAASTAPVWIKCMGL